MSLSYSTAYVCLACSSASPSAIVIATEVGVNTVNTVVNASLAEQRTESYTKESFLAQCLRLGVLSAGNPMLENKSLTLKTLFEAGEYPGKHLL